MAQQPQGSLQNPTLVTKAEGGQDDKVLLVHVSAQQELWLQKAAQLAFHLQDIAEPTTEALLLLWINKWGPAHLYQQAMEAQGFK